MWSAVTEWLVFMAGAVLFLPKLVIRVFHESMYKYYPQYISHKDRLDVSRIDTFHQIICNIISSFSILEWKLQKRCSVSIAFEVSKVDMFWLITQETT